MVKEYICVLCGTETIDGIGQKKKCDCYDEKLEDMVSEVSEHGRGGVMACGKMFTEEEMKKMGTMTRCCTNNIYIKLLCKECKAKENAIKEKKQ